MKGDVLTRTPVQASPAATTRSGSTVPESVAPALVVAAGDGSLSLSLSSAGVGEVEAPTPTSSSPNAVEDVIQAVRSLARERGHNLQPRAYVGFVFTMTCTLCTRAVTFDLAPGNQYPSIGGGAMGACRKKRWGPIAAEPMQNGEGNRLA